MEVGVLMSAGLTTKYTTVDVDTDGAEPTENYYGYIAVRLDCDSGDAMFFSQTHDLRLLDLIKQFFKEIPEAMTDKEIRIEDTAIFINLPSINSKIYATDVVRIVKQTEEEYLKRITP